MKSVIRYSYGQLVEGPSSQRRYNGINFPRLLVKWIATAFSRGGRANRGKSLAGRTAATGARQVCQQAFERGEFAVIWALWLQINYLSKGDKVRYRAPALMRQ